MNKFHGSALVVKSNTVRAGLEWEKALYRLVAISALICSLPASAAIIADDFKQATATNSWITLGDACLTAGSIAAPAAIGSIPKCTGPTSPTVPFQPDPVGSGALRLTPALGSLDAAGGSRGYAGAIISNFTFPTNQGLQITFTTYTYGGNSRGVNNGADNTNNVDARDGSDGIGFFLQDGSASQPSSTGARGGSLGYSCSNVNSDQADGLSNAYLGLGIDEFGNFLNGPTNNTNTGVTNTNDSGVTTYGSNTFLRNVGGNEKGAQFQSMRIGLRGAGNTTATYLNSKNPAYYTDRSPNAPSTQAACRSGQYVSAQSSSGTLTYSNLPYNYAVINNGYRVLPGTQKIAAESASTRTDALVTPITYKLAIAPSGLLNFSYSYNNGNYQQVLVNQDISSVSGSLPSSLRFGFSGSTGAGTNVHEITCFQVSPNQSNSSAGANAVQAGQIKTNTQLYLTYYNPNNWYSSLVSDPLVVDLTTKAVSVGSNANWDASCVLTGGACPAMGTDAAGNATRNITVQSPSNRNLLTWNGSVGIPLQWNSLTALQKLVLQSTDTNTSAGQDRLNWLRGVRTNETLKNSNGYLRYRDGVLGDIIGSSPTVVGQPVAGANPDAFSDALYGGTSAETSYNSFVNNRATRTNVVYVGSNDGLVHGFRTGSYDTSGNYVASTNDGQEVIGFMPSTVLTNSNGLSPANVVDLTNPLYSHHYFVDATPAAADLFYGNAWHTWLVGGLGLGGKEIYALDVTDPDNAGSTQFIEANASTLVKGSWTGSALSLDPCLSHLGNTVGTPIISRLHNGQWAIIFGNGLNSGNSAGVCIGVVNSSTGAVTSPFLFLDTGVGSASSPNGISYVTSADLDGDHITDYLYAGDLRGNIWRFDLTSNTATNWAVSTFKNSTPTPLFVAKIGSTVQPVTTALAVAAIKTGSVYRVLTYFGTGQVTAPTSGSGTTYATTGTQTFYGIWDWDLSTWPPGASAGTQYANLTSAQTITRFALLQQTLASTSTATTRSFSSSTVVCWKGTTCSDGSTGTQYGFYFDLPGGNSAATPPTYEQIIYNPVVVGSAVVVNTAIPPVISAAQCNPGVQTGFTMAFSLTSGGGLPQSFFPDSSNSYSPNNGTTIEGVQQNATGSPAVLTSGGNVYLGSQQVNGTGIVQQVNQQLAGSSRRVSWRELK